MNLAPLVFKYNVKELVKFAHLAEDAPQLQMKTDKSMGISLDHISLLKTGPPLPSANTLVEVSSTRENLMAVGKAVSVCQPVLLLGDVGVGKTSIVMEWVARCGREILSVQISDNTDARLLVGMYRCIELPG